MKRFTFILALVIGIVGAANAKSYDVLINGIQVNDTNREDVLGDGTVSYDGTTKTLTLNNTHISCDGKNAVTIKESQPVTLQCIGTNTISVTNDGFAVSANSTTIFTGPGSISMHSHLNTFAGFSGGLTIQDGCTVTLQSEVATCLVTRVVTVDNADLVAKGNGTTLTASCSGLNMKNGVQILSRHTYDAAQMMFLNPAGEVAKDDIVIGHDNRTVIKEVNVKNLHAPTAGFRYNSDSMRATLNVPEDAVYGLKANSVNLYKMTNSVAEKVADNAVITTGRYYVTAQVSINDKDLNSYRFPSKKKDIKIGSITPYKWSLMDDSDGENILLYSNTFTVFPAYAFPEELPEDLTEYLGDTIRIYGVNGSLKSLSAGATNFKDIGSALTRHPKEYGYDAAALKLSMRFGGYYYNIPILSAFDWIDFYVGESFYDTYDYAYQPCTMPTQRPDMKDAKLVVCGTNIENYFSNYKEASKEFNKSPATEKEFITKTQKVVAAFTTIDAQIYAMYEIGTGQSVHVLCDSLNKRYPNHPYAPLDCKFGTSTYQSVAYIYDSTKLDLVSAPTCLYSSGYMRYRMSLITFRDRETQTDFILCATHLKAFDDGESERIEQVTKLKNALRPHKQKNVLIVGDMNSHSLDVPCQMLADEYGDLLYLHDSLGFSYFRNDEVAYLDHAYASPSMTEYVTMATTMHLNSIVSTSYGFSYGDTTMYRYADHDPILVGLKFPPKIDDLPSLPYEGPVGKGTKFLHDGQLIILHQGKRYNAQGAVLK